MSPDALFSSGRIGNCNVEHRVVLAPMTRLRNSVDNIPTDLSVEYYRQRSSVPGTFLISEGSAIAPQVGVFPFAPGIYNQAQVEGWKRVTEIVHANKSHIFLQLWAGGRIVNPSPVEKTGIAVEVVSSGDIPLDDKHVTPRPLTKEEITEYVSLYALAGKRAIEAGFDGVEVHGANGYLVDQFIQDTANNRTDECGGSIENRSRFPLEILQALVEAVGASRTAIRFSPWDRYQHMRMEDPIPQFSYLVSTIAERWPDLAYIHVAEARGARTPEGQYLPASDSIDFLREIWSPRPFVACGGYTPETALETVAEAARRGENMYIAFARHFLANPDLPSRIQKRQPLNPYDRSTFYAAGSPKGYVDYPFAQ